MLLGLLGMSYGRLLFCGSPHDDAYQVHLTSAHLCLRMGGASREGVPFGGVQVYGDQTGNGEIGLPGNIHRDQLLAAQALVESLGPAARRAARRPRAPSQTAVSTQGAAGRFEGVSLADASKETRDKARAFIALVLGNYAPEDARAAWDAIETSGGLGAFHVADYDLDHQGGRSYADRPSQIFRLESPSAVFHYRGEPHLHAFFNVERDAEAPLSVGPIVARVATPIEGDGARAIFEAALREGTGEERAWYPRRAVCGRVRAGVVREGDVYCLEGWDDRMAVIDVERAELSNQALAEIDAAATRKVPSDRLRLAVPEGVALFHSEYGIGRHDVVARVARPMRRAAIDELRSRSTA